MRFIDLAFLVAGQAPERAMVLPRLTSKSTHTSFESTVPCVK